LRTEQPYEDEESAFDKNEKAGVLGSGDFRKEEGQKEKAGDKQERKEQDNQEVGKDIEPVAMDDGKNLFIFMLFPETAIADLLWHRCFNFNKNKGAECLRAGKKR